MFHDSITYYYLWLLVAFFIVIGIYTCFYTLFIISVFGRMRWKFLHIYFLFMTNFIFNSNILYIYYDIIKIKLKISLSLFNYFQELSFVDLGFLLKLNCGLMESFFDEFCCQNFTLPLVWYPSCEASTSCIDNKI